jgi:hypothetical protein
LKCFLHIDIEDYIITIIFNRPRHNDTSTISRKYVNAYQCEYGPIAVAITTCSNTTKSVNRPSILVHLPSYL